MHCQMTLQISLQNCLLNLTSCHRGLSPSLPEIWVKGDRECGREFQPVLFNPVSGLLLWKLEYNSHKEKLEGLGAKHYWLLSQKVLDGISLVEPALTII